MTRYASRPLRSFKIEHHILCRYVISPRWRDRQLSLGALQARRMEAAWRTIRVTLKTNTVQDTIQFARTFSSMWGRMAVPLSTYSNCPPPFEFDDLDAVRMVLDAAEFDR